MKLSIAFFAMLLFADVATAQTITNGDGSALTTKYCYVDQDFEIKGQPTGGTFNGCGVKLQNGQWIFNPVIATAGVTVFPFQCAVNYTMNNHTISRTILIQKPVKINPPLQETQTCDGKFTLAAYTLYAGAYDYRWEPAAFLDKPDTSVTSGFINQTATFVITATDLSSGCTGSDQITVNKRPIPVVTVAPEEKTIKSREQVQLVASGAGNYYWPGSRWLNNDKIGSPIASPMSPITYMVVGVNEYGCADTAEVTIKINDGLFVPNVFSPNGDGQNDLFKIENFGYQKVEEFRVYNRWGKLVYETIDGTQGWDGNYNGKHADAGTYYYQIKIRLTDNEAKIFKGDLTLVR
jgi:gliding motility-associated-like protein